MSRLYSARFCVIALIAQIALGACKSATQDAGEKQSDLAPKTGNSLDDASLAQYPVARDAAMPQSTPSPLTPVSVPGEEPDEVLSKDAWELRIYYTQKGTRSEGIRGLLMREGKRLPPPAVANEIIDTPLGRMKFYQHMQAWSPWGWLPENLAPFRPSGKR